MKQTLLCFNLQRNGIGTGFSNIKNTFVESFQLQISVLYQNMCIFSASLSSLSNVWAKYKEKIHNVSDSNQTVETTSSFKHNFTEL